MIQIGEEEDENTTVTSGLEAEDQIIISSQQPIEEGQVLSEGPVDGFEEYPDDADTEEPADDTEADVPAEEEE